MKIVVLAHNDPFASLLLSELFRSKEKYSIEKIFFSKRIFQKNSSFQLLLKAISKSGVRFTWYKVMEVLLTRIVFILKDLLGKGTFSLGKYAKNYGIETETCDDFNNADFLYKMQCLQPDIIISTRFNPILREPQLNVPKFGCINFHGAYLPTYKGLFSTFHAICRQDTYIGYTLHFMDKKIDHGSIITRETFKVNLNDTLLNIDIKIHLLGAKALIRTLEDIETGQFNTISISHEKSNYFSFPDKKDVSAFIRNGGRFFKLRDFLKLFIV